MRDGEARLVDDLVAVEDEVEVDGAGPPPLFAGPIAAKRPLDLKE
jgi:hypothetical protein